MFELSLMQKIAVGILPLLFAITLHEVAHGWTAKRLGDSTAARLGRLSLNPIKHIDPIGTLLVPLVLFVLTDFVFGWAKPVPVAWENLRRPQRDMALVALAGPVANLLMAIAWALFAKLGFALASVSPVLSEMFILMGVFGIFINVILMVLNLLPLPPLDGGRIVAGLLPGPLSYKFGLIEPYGFFILLGLLATGLLGQIIGPSIQWVQNLIMVMIGL